MQSDDDAGGNAPICEPRCLIVRALHCEQTDGPLSRFNWAKHAWDRGNSVRAIRSFVFQGLRSTRF
jgi:hypothetical protein